MRLAPPMRFRLHADDWPAYGDGWTVYDESALVRVPAAELVEIERQIGMSVLTMLHRARANFVDANLAAMWVARRLAGDKRPYAEWQPLVLLAEWEQAGAGDVDPPDQSSSPPPSTG